jgi:phosphatidate phosphatase
MRITGDEQAHIYDNRQPYSQGVHVPVGAINGNVNSSTALQMQQDQQISAGSASDGSWNPFKIDWGFVIRSQHYGMPLFTIGYIIILGVVHWVSNARQRPFYLYDASISYSSGGDTVPSWVAVVIPLILLIISMLAFEFIIYRKENFHITNAVATFVHYLLDCLCAFICVIMVTEITKFAAGRLRPDFLETCAPTVSYTSGPAVLGATPSSVCTRDTTDVRKSFCSGHSSSSAVITIYNIVYLVWAGYIRGGDAAFMGLDKKTGWRGGHRFLRELGHGFYLVWIMLNFGFVWAVGITRFTDNKHHISDILGGWFLGAVFALIYSIRATACHKYVIIHDAGMFDKRVRRQMFRQKV